MQIKTFLFVVLLVLSDVELAQAQVAALPPTANELVLGEEDWEVVLGEEDLAERGEVLRNMYRRITPPDMKTLVQNVGALPAAWEEFGSQWENATATREYGVWLVPVVLSQAFGETVMSDADGRVFWRGTNDFARPESSGIILTGGLVAEEEWPVYSTVREAVVGMETQIRGEHFVQLSGLRSSLTNGLRFTSHSFDTNGAVCLGLAWDQDGDIDIFVYPVAHTSSWVVATWTNDENAVVTDTNLVWTATAPRSPAWKVNGNGAGPLPSAMAREFSWIPVFPKAKAVCVSMQPLRPWTPTVMASTTVGNALSATRSHAIPTPTATASMMGSKCR